MKRLFLFSFYFLLISCTKENNLLDAYKAEISALKTETEIDKYWDSLLDLDQKALENKSQSIKHFDSLSLNRMIRTALMFEIHGSKTYKHNNIVPEMNLSHNYFGIANLAFWPIIKECVKVRGDRKILQYPSYQLECISQNLYDYSLFNQNEKYAALLNKLNKIESNTVSKDLYEALNYQTKLNKLKVVSVKGKWQRQPFKTMKEDGFFEFVKMSDNALYYMKNERIQRLELIKTDLDYKLYRIEKEPFGWIFLKEFSRYFIPMFPAFMSP